MAILIGERKTFWWNGEKYIFQRTGKGRWKCVYQDHPIIPEALISQLGE